DPEARVHPVQGLLEAHLLAEEGVRDLVAGQGVAHAEDRERHASDPAIASPPSTRMTEPLAQSKKGRHSPWMAPATSSVVVRRPVRSSTPWDRMNSKWGASSVSTTAGWSLCPMAIERPARERRRAVARPKPEDPPRITAQRPEP